MTPERRGVVDAEEGGGERIAHEHQLGRRAPALGGAVAIDDEPRIDRNAGAGERGPIPVLAHAADRALGRAADKGDAAMTLRDEMLGRDAGALEIVDADEGDRAAGNRLVDRHHGRQARLAVVLAEAIGQVAGEEDEPVGLVGADEAQIVGFAAGIVLGIADQHAIAALAGLGLEPDEDVGEVRIAHVGGEDEDHVGAAHAQRARHGIGGVAGLRDGGGDAQTRRVGHLGGLVDGSAHRGDGHACQGRDILDSGQFLLLHSALRPAPRPLGGTPQSP